MTQEEKSVLKFSTRFDIDNYGQFLSHSHAKNFSLNFLEHEEFES